MSIEQFTKSTRTFKVWEYQISLGQLLIRSPKAPATETNSEQTTNLDLVFLGVDYMAVPRLLRGLEIDSATSHEVEELTGLLGKAVETGHVRILVSDGKRFPIVASNFSYSENEWDIFESPFEFRSRFRGR